MKAMTLSVPIFQVQCDEPGCRDYVALIYDTEVFFSPKEIWLYEVERRYARWGGLTLPNGKHRCANCQARIKAELEAMPKHQASDEKPKRQYRFCNEANFVWDGTSWQMSDLADWWGDFQTRATGALESFAAATSALPSNVLVQSAKNRVDHCLTSAVFHIDPEPMFLRMALDDWVDAQASWVWAHVYDHHRLVLRVHEGDAAYEADKAAFEFEALFAPTLSRAVQKPKARKKK